MGMERNLDLTISVVERDVSRRTRSSFVERLLSLVETRLAYLLHLRRLASRASTYIRLESAKDLDLLDILVGHPVRNDARLCDDIFNPDLSILWNQSRRHPPMHNNA